MEWKDGDLFDEELLKVFIIYRYNVEIIFYIDMWNDYVKFKEVKNNYLYIY